MAWVEKHKSLWRGRYRDADGKTRATPGDSSKRRALKAAQDEEAKIRGGTWQDPTAGSLTFSVYFEEHWLPNRVEEQNTIMANESHYNASLKDAFGSTLVNKISRAQI